MYKIVKLGQLLILKVYIYLFIFICKCKIDLRYDHLGSYHYLYNVEFFFFFFLFFLNCVEDTQRLYQNGLNLHLVRENQDFDLKINMYIL